MGDAFTFDKSSPSHADARSEYVRKPGSAGHRSFRLAQSGEHAVFDFRSVRGTEGNDQQAQSEPLRSNTRTGRGGIRLRLPHHARLRERQCPYLHTWVLSHVGRIIEDFQDSVKREPLIPAGAPLDFVPTAKP